MCKANSHARKTDSRNVLAVERAEQSLIAAKQELHAVQQEVAGDVNSGKEPGPLHSQLAHSLLTSFLAQVNSTTGPLVIPPCGGAATDSRGIVLPTLSTGPTSRAATATDCSHPDECWVTTAGKPADKKGGHPPIRPLWGNTSPKAPGNGEHDRCDGRAESSAPFDRRKGGLSAEFYVLACKREAIRNSSPQDLFPCCHQATGICNCIG